MRLVPVVFVSGKRYGLSPSQYRCPAADVVMSTGLSGSARRAESSPLAGRGHDQDGGLASIGRP